MAALDPQQFSYDDCQAVYPGKLFIGSLAAATNRSRLQQCKITHVVTLTPEAPIRPFQDMVTYLYRPVRDEAECKISEVFEECLNFIADALSKNGVVLVHCTAGISRSGAVTIAYVMKDRKIPLREALDVVRNARPVVFPNIGFMKQLLNFEMALYGSTSLDLHACRIQLAQNVITFFARKSPLVFAALQGENNICRALIEAGTPVDPEIGDGLTPLYAAASSGNVELTQFFLSCGAQVNKTSGGTRKITPLYIASRNGHSDVCRVLLEHGADVNVGRDNNATALLSAAHHGHYEVCKVLLEHGANVNLKALHSSNPLLSAAQAGYASICELLLKHGALTQDTLQNRSTCLFLAAQHGHADVATVLIAAGCSVNMARTSDRCTPLIVAALQGHVDVCLTLLDGGADVNATRAQGETALICASWMGHFECCALLVSRGAQVLIRASQGTAADYATCAGHHELAQALREREQMAMTAVVTQPVSVPSDMTGVCSTAVDVESEALGV